MSKQEKEFTLIPRNEYIDDLEEIVQSSTRDAYYLPKNDVLYTKEEIPDFDNPREQQEWEFEQVRRCIEGYKGMSGKMYFFYHFCKIRNLSRGAISPQFRVCQNEWFSKIEEAQNSEEWGLVCVKRRRVGASWLEAADALHDCIFNQFFHVGINSKTKHDSFHLFSKILFIYERLPEFLQASIGRRLNSETMMGLEFFDKKRSKLKNKREGNNSQITVVAPTDSAYEGLQLSKWVCDEAGKISNLPQMWSFTEDCLMEEYKRIGTPVLFGTSGDIATNGGGLLNMWDNADTYKLFRFFFAGWMGIAADEYGNDLKEEVIRWIIYERKRRESLDSKSYNDFIQRYPLTTQEAFSQAGGGLGDVIKLNAQKHELRTNPVIVREGRLYTSEETGDLIFRNEKFGDLKIYEHPSENESYTIGIDPADHDDAGAESSDLSLHVIKLPNGLSRPKIVAEYCCRPRKLNEYYDQAAKICQYYNDSRALIENNRYRIISYFKENGYNKYLALTPHQVNTIFKKKNFNNVGIRMTEDVKNYMEGIIGDYVDDYCDLIPSIDLINEILEYGTRNTDRVFSFGLALIMLKDYLSNKRRKEVNKNHYNPRVPNVSWQLKNGVLKRVTNRTAQ